MTRIVVLISGRGSNMQAIVNACRSGKLDADVVAVISNRPDAAGLQFAADHGIETAVIDHRTFESRDAFDKAMEQQLLHYRPDWIALAGFMRILGEPLVNAFAGKIINIHPSLLPRYPGLDTHAKVLASGDAQHGASVHFVTAKLDAGPIISQAVIDVLPTDTRETLASRVLSEEHGLYVSALQRCITGVATYHGPRTGTTTPEPVSDGTAS